MSTETQKTPTITIDNIEYDMSSVTPEVSGILESIRMIDEELKRIRITLDITKITKAKLVLDLKEHLTPVVKDIDKATNNEPSATEAKSAKRKTKEPTAKSSNSKTTSVKDKEVKPKTTKSKTTKSKTTAGTKRKTANKLPEM